METHAQYSIFGKEAWTILSDIELSIKTKVESVGVPLKDWDVDIYRGVLTGYNDAFIISSEKRNEILNNCADDDERERTAAIIRPILRGRDIARYTYNWANLWLINTHNGIKGSLNRIHIEDYPAIKQHLDCYWDKIKPRADQGDTPYNLRNCAYVDDFLKPKIIWKRVGSILRFSYDNQGFFGLDSTCFATGNEIAFICCLLNSSMGHYLLNGAPRTGTGDLLISVQAVEPIRIPPIPPTLNDTCKNLIDNILHNPGTTAEDEVDDLIFSLYGLTDEEKEYLIANFRE